MNRRRFLGGLIAATAAFSILPAATTYHRNLVKPSGQTLWVVNPDWVTADYELAFAGLYSIGDGLRAPEIKVRYRENKMAPGGVRVIPNIDGSCFKVIPQFICQTQ